jgi:WD40 repeat protein
LDTGANLTTFRKHSGNVNKVIRINDENIATISDDQSLKVWNSSTGHYICRYNHSGQVKSVVVLPNGLIATGTCGDNLVYIWNVTSGINVANLTGHTDCVMDLVYNSRIGTSGSLISASLDRIVNVWDLSGSFALTRSIADLGEWAYCLLVVPSNGWIYTASTFINWWDTSFAHLSYKALDAKALSMALSPENGIIALALVNGAINLFSLSSASVVGRLNNAHSGSINAIMFIRLPGVSQAFFATGGDDNYVKIWGAGSTSLTQVATSINIGSAVKSLFFLYNQTDAGELKILDFFLANCCFICLN